MVVMVGVRMGKRRALKARRRRSWSVLPVSVSMPAVGGVHLCLRLRLHLSMVVVRGGRVMMMPRASSSSSSSSSCVGRVVIVRGRRRRVRVRVRWRRVGCHVNDRVPVSERGGGRVVADHAGGPVVGDATATVA